MGLQADVKNDLVTGAIFEEPYQESEGWAQKHNGNWFLF